MSKTKEEFIYDGASGITFAHIYYKNNKFTGGAICAPEDFDMMSEKTGQEIASARAQILFFKHIKDNELMPKLEILNQVYCSMKQSKYFNEESFEAKKIRKEIKNLKTDLNNIRGLINQNKDFLSSYIKNKEEFYQKIRKIRNKDNNE